MSKKDTSQQSGMPLRNNRHQVDILVMPGQHRPTLGFKEKAEDSEAKRRANSIKQWGGRESPRQNDTEAAALDFELDKRTSTALYYDVPKKVQDKLTGNNFSSDNKGRNADEQTSSERISVKIRID